MATNLTTLFKNIADAIRAKTGSSEQIVAENFPAAINGIQAHLSGTVANNTARGNSVDLAAGGIPNTAETILLYMSVVNETLQNNDVVGVKWTPSATFVSYYNNGQVANDVDTGATYSESKVLTLSSNYTFPVGRFTFIGN